MPNPIKKTLKRTKTYSGCWTCRARGVKCDLVRPACARCTRSKRTCEGYGIRLVWVGQELEPNKVIERRLVNASNHRNPVFSEDHLESALEDLDAFGSQEDLQITPYTVFRGFEAEQEHELAEHIDIDTFNDVASEVCDGDSVFGALSPDTAPQVDTTSMAHCIPQLNDNLTPIADSPSNSDETADEDVRSDGHVTLCSDNLKIRLFPLLQTFLSEATRDERKLLHHWVTSMSGMMVAIPSSDNPYQSLYIPLALAAANAPGGFSGHSALLHGIYTISAINLAQLRNDANYSVAAARHQQLSLQYLQNSLQESKLCTVNERLNQQREVILAVMVLLSATDVIGGTSSTWRVHLREGKRYLSSIFSQSTMTKTASTLYQLFLCLDMIGSENRIDTYRTFPDVNEMQEQTYLTDAFDNGIINDDDYCLDRMFGITKPVAEIIQTTNRLIQRSYGPSEEELVALESRLVLANPSTDMIDYEDPQSARMLRHHRCAFYFAAVIHYRISLCRVPSSQIQHLVEDSLYHLQTIDTIEINLNASGLFWPVFVTACEADDESFRKIAMQLLSKGERCGIGNIRKALEVVQEVWARRDGGYAEAKSSRHEVMKCLGLDLLLA